ncbi:hypothetical protein [Clostridium vincentii]|uniref:Uncharacterized protein n=1 Tax=Clostridium vincentii TaxID=52704 RepID=A0A2T0BED5_9CLOT|nr:hypothetical protein [Clostridium vincentii]PRR82235.1 hypothetical protein CLVI_18950 [Clostridium vincentii]
MDDNSQKHIYDKTNISTKAHFIVKYIFYGLLFGGYWYIIFEISQKGIVGTLLALAMSIISFFHRDIIDPVKTNKNELGKYTNIIGQVISIITITFLWFYISNF